MKNGIDREGSLHIAGAPTWQKSGILVFARLAATAVQPGRHIKTSKTCLDLAQRACIRRLWRGGDRTNFKRRLPGQQFEFTEFHHVLHAISVEFVPAVHSFQRVALQKLGHDTDTTVTTTPRLRLDLTNEQLALLCWGKRPTIQSTAASHYHWAPDLATCHSLEGARFLHFRHLLTADDGDCDDHVQLLLPAGGLLPFAMATFQDAVMSPRVQDVVETEGLEDWPIDGTHSEWKGFLQQQFSKQAALLQQLTLHLREETQAGIKLENKKLSQAVQEQFAKQAKLLQGLQVPPWPSARPGEIALIADEQAELKTTQAAEEGTEPAQEGSPENARDNKPALHSWNSTWQHDDEHPEPQSKAQAVALTIVHSASFTYAITFLILVNMVILGIEVDVASTLPPYQEPRWFGLINLTIVVIFVAELVLKFVAYGCRGFIHGPERWWNLFDVIIIGTSVLETIMEFVTIWMAAMQMDSSHLRVMRFARIARALRGVRAVRFLRFVSALRTLVFSILSTMWSLIWTLVLLILLFYCFAVILTQLVTDHCRYNEGGVVNCSPDLMRFWKSVAESMLTLFISISGGLSWSEALQPLREVSEIAFLCMVVYIVLTVLAILNVVTGVFCNNAIESARADKDIAIMKQMQKHAKQLKSLRGVFKEIDNDQSNLVSLQELKDALKSKKLASFLESMDISTQDIWTLFMVMDSDGSGDVTLEEFVTGCMQLQGPAQSIQLARMRHENLKTRGEILRVGADIGNLKALFHELLRRQGELHL
ncbi:Scn11a [Symbiodinium microadriaticum]|nr:Scn11a [Symbiodinium microadriaticum]